LALKKEAELAGLRYNRSVYRDEEHVCVRACPVDRIYDADDQFLINPTSASIASMCMPGMLVEAIYPARATVP